MASQKTGDTRQAIEHTAVKASLRLWDDAEESISPGALLGGASSTGTIVAWSLSRREVIPEKSEKKRALEMSPCLLIFFFPYLFSFFLFTACVW